MPHLHTLFIILDGLGDSSCERLEGRTPLQASTQKNITRFLKHGSTGLLTPIAPGVPPSSDTAHLSIFGYDIKKEYPGRGPFEALGSGVYLKEGEIAFRANIATVEIKGDHIIVLDRRAGRMPSEETAELAKMVNEELGNVDGLEFELVPTLEHRAVLVVRGEGLCHQVSDTDPHETGVPLLKSQPLEESENIKGSLKLSNALNKWTVKMIKLLENSPLNEKRRKANLPIGNIFLARSPGVMTKLVSFEDKWGMKAGAVAAGQLYRGVALMLGMDLFDAPGATGLPNTDIGSKLKVALSKIDRYDFMFVHIKATDVFSHKKDPLGKKEFIEKFDSALSIIKEDFVKSNVLVITGDHSTPCNRGMHSGDPVPFLLAGPLTRIDRTTHFDELNARKGLLGFIRGEDVMPLILDATERTIEYGTRPSPRKVNYIPRDLTPLKISEYSR
ncbi:phosphoglycerate mutase [archaeon]|nr:MAG: phosphoglycerate mutase [archaeon]